MAEHVSVINCLQGLTVAITGSRRASELASLVTSFGGKAYIAPTVGIELKQEISKEAEGFINRIVGGNVDYAVFMTGPGVYSLMFVAKRLGLDDVLIKALRQVTVVARSSKPKDALAKHEVKTDIVPEENTAEGIARVLKSRDMEGKEVSVLWHGSYSPILKDELQSAGAEVFESSTYTYSLKLENSGAQILETMGFKYVAPDEGKVIKLIEDLNSGCLDVITFTSPPSARNLFTIADAHRLKEPLQQSLNKNVVVVAVGPPTRKSLEENGVHVDVIPERYKMGPMVKALCDYVSSPDNAKAKGARPYGRLGGC